MIIPELIRPLLWEFDTEDPSGTETMERVIIERVMQRGSWEQMRWLLRQYSRDRLRRFIQDRGRRVLPPRELNFWARQCGFPESVIREWLVQAKNKEKQWRGIP